MKITVVLFALLATVAEGYAPQPSKASNKFKLSDFKQASLGAFAAMTIASNVMAAPAEAVDTFAFSSSTILSEKVVREGLYRDYEVDIVQQKDDAESTFKSAKETKSKKGKYTALLAVLIVGSFVIPMAQYFWYVRDDDSSDKFFAEDVPEPPTKKKWF
jgi:hypothetical protein